MAKLFDIIGKMGSNLENESLALFFAISRSLKIKCINEKIQKFKKKNFVSLTEKCDVPIQLRFMKIQFYGKVCLIKF